MQTAPLDRDLIRPSDGTRSDSLVASPLVAPAFLNEHDPEEVRVEDSASVNDEGIALRDCHEALCDKFGGSTVTIVMGTYQGELFLNEQLHSIAAQTHRNWRLCVSDDGSTDETRAIVRELGATLRGRNKVDLVDGPRKGFVANFLTSICQA